MMRRLCNDRHANDFAFTVEESRLNAFIARGVNVRISPYLSTNIYITILMKVDCIVLVSV